MRLYSRLGVVSLDDPDYGTFTADERGGFDFPDDVSDRLHGFHYQGKPMWESEIERANRLITEEQARRADPSTLLSAVEQLVRAAQATTALTAPVAVATEAVAGLAANLAAPVPEPAPEPVSTPAPAPEPAPAPAPAEPEAKPTRRRASKPATK
jgi:hypothetical protein